MIARRIKHFIEIHQLSPRPQGLHRDEGRVLALQWFGRTDDLKQIGGSASGQCHTSATVHSNAAQP